MKKRTLFSKLLTALILGSVCFFTPLSHAKEPSINNLSDEELKKKLRMFFLVADHFDNYREQYGGYIFYKSNVHDNICSLKKPGSLYLVDHEGGRVNRIGSGLPSAKDALKTSHYLSMWERDANELKKMCFDVVLGPTIDKKLGDRSFTDDLQKNLQMAGEIKNVLGKEKLITTYKHFPGRYDSCKQHDEKEIEYCDEDKKSILKDWQYFKNNDVPAIMISNYVYDGISSKPAVLEDEYYKILRNDLNYQGVITTDALWEMSVPLTETRVWNIFKNADLIMIMNAFDVEKYMPSLIYHLKHENADEANQLLQDKTARIEKLKKIIEK